MQPGQQAVARWVLPPAPELLARAVRPRAVRPWAVRPPAVRPPARFGGLVFDEKGMVKDFTEKPQIGEGWINGGFMVFEPEVFKYLEHDHTVLEAHVLEKLAEKEQLAAYRHDGFWQCMDTMRDVKVLEALWQGGKPPWRV